MVSIHRWLHLPIEIKSRENHSYSQGDQGRDQSYESGFPCRLLGLGDDLEYPGHETGANQQGGVGEGEICIVIAVEPEGG